mgnify:CR=1 FL=1
MNMETIKLDSVIVDIAAGPFGSNLKVSCFVDYGFPIIDGANLKGYKVTDNITKYVTEEKANSLYRSIAHRNDVIVTISGTLGQIAYIPNDSAYEAYLCSQRQFRVTFDEKRVFVPYIVYYFHTYEGQHKILSFANQTGVPALSQPLKNFKNIEINLPSLEIQKRIASILLSIDEKIELNNKINENLEQQAQAIFKSWFVDFEPFGGVMPDDWRMGTLSEICDYSKDKVDIDDLTLDTYYSTENMQPNRQGAVQATTLPTIKQTTACKKGDVLISNIRPYFKKILYCFSDCGCSTDVLCFVPNKTDYSAFLYCALYADKFFDYMVTGSKGTKMPRGDKQQIMVYPICIPSAEYIEKFNQAVAPMLETVYTNRIEANNLANLRDTLLPKLMNGEIDVSAVEI